jgi:L-seryl-tRNA(Ser) seleniumtransferase
VLLCLAACARGREVVVSRGELIEIGGSFRVPDVMRLSGATLVEVGTTNKTRAADYLAAIGDATGLLLKVHRSNFAIVGFTEEVAAAELAGIGQGRAVLTMVDLGSGAMIDGPALAAMGLPPEPGVRETIGAGIDLVTFSGDKLLGGPQAGIVCGRRDAIAVVRSHPMMRALRPDKLCLAALEATLALYRDGRAAEVQVLAMLGAKDDALRHRAEALAAAIAPRPGVVVAAEACRSAVGGGALPLADQGSWATTIAGVPLDALDRALRAGDPPVVGRIAGKKLLLDLRTVGADAIAPVAAAVDVALQQPEVMRWS